MQVLVLGLKNKSGIGASIKMREKKCLGIQTCFIVMAGLQSLSSSRIDRHTVPDGYTFGWKSGGSNLPETQKMLSALMFGIHYNCQTRRTNSPNVTRLFYYLN